MSYSVIESVDVLDDRVLQGRLVRWGAMVFVVGVFLTVAWALLGGPMGRWGQWPEWLVASAVGSFVALPVHELVHALCFKLLGPAGLKVRFGYQDGMLYAGAPGAVLTRDAMLVVLLAPAAVLTVGFVVLGCVLDAPFVAMVCIWVHLSGCVGDVLMAVQIWKHPEASHVRDTETGIALLKEVAS
ncbi:DUF3267 domain-containing protein [Olsenella sp. YH-ols2217]|uniref:DUF3267 domain-containing protein n=1 Tax=Kribbibacterium absianum TaxID=3044210 RepID=A0ABT6ZHJ7_9ACTN|nr:MULTISPECIES: DUF3267 domain-containing protein [unclassified Olsenella]MDJ1121013.1 DUF3267 domain-containing protein [Olsenella sp. YH-ols2216]MDJ1128504.1 DUF3267 domain-containing protein [Olsenella sp. YH-ols2217]